MMKTIFAIDVIVLILLAAAIIYDAWSRRK